MSFWVHDGIVWICYTVEDLLLIDATGKGRYSNQFPLPCHMAPRKAKSRSSVMREVYRQDKPRSVSVVYDLRLGCLDSALCEPQWSSRPWWVDTTDAS
jgi:hypothetical protein